MGEVQSGADNDIDLRLGRNDKNNEAQVDTAMAVAARSFGAPLPLRVPFWKAASIETQAVQAQNLDDAGMTTKSGLAGQKTREEIKAEKDKKSGERLRDLVAIVADEQKRQREEWERTKSSIGGVEMTGREWGEFADRLRRDDQLREKILSAYRAQGMSEADAMRRCDRVADVADAMKVPPSQRTEEQTSLIEKTKNDPSFSSDMKTAHNVALQDVKQPSVAVQQTAAPAPVVAVLDGPGF